VSGDRLAEIKAQSFNQDDFNLQWVIAELERTRAAFLEVVEDARKARREAVAHAGFAENTAAEVFVEVPHDDTAEKEAP
jgi:hypothetical protein